MKKIIKKLYRLLLYTLLFTYYLIEEIVWNNFAKPIYRYIKYLRIFEAFDRFLSKQNRYVVLIFFILPFVIGEVFGILSPVVLVAGFPIFAIVLYILKLLIASLAFWVFNNHKDTLLSFNIINYLYQKIMALVDIIKNSYIYQNMVEKLHLIKDFLKKRFIEIKNYLTKLFKRL